MLTEKGLRRPVLPERWNLGRLGIFEPCLMDLKPGCRGLASTSTSGVDILELAAHLWVKVVVWVGQMD